MRQQELAQAAEIWVLILVVMEEGLRLVLTMRLLISLQLS